MINFNFEKKVKKNVTCVPMIFIIDSNNIYNLIILIIQVHNKKIKYKDNKVQVYN